MSLTVSAPVGAHFEFSEVKTKKGSETLGEKPLLVWDSLESAREFYGEQGLLDILDGTSIRVSGQGIARRLGDAGKSDDEIAQAQINFRPGKRAGGASTPQSRLQRETKAAVEKGVDADKLRNLIARVAAGELELDEEGNPVGV